MDASHLPEPWLDAGFASAPRDARLVARFFLALAAIVALAGAAGFLAGTLVSDTSMVGLRCGHPTLSDMRGTIHEGWTAEFGLPRREASLTVYGSDKL